MIQDDSQGPQLQNLQQPGATPPPAPGNQLNNLMQGGQAQPAPQITKHQVIAGLHHFQAIQKQISPLLKSPELGKKNIRPKLFDAMAALIGQQIMTVPEVINGIRDLPDDPVEQKKWLELKLGQTMQAEQMLIAHYIQQGPGPEPEGPEWSMDNHRDHMGGLLGAFKKG